MAWASGSSLSLPTKLFNIARLPAGTGLVYLVTHIVTFRAHRNRCSKARFAGNIGNIGKKRNDAAAVSVGSHRASRRCGSLKVTI